ncbi:MAG: tetratricopeptide repeat protein [Gammaproteobacteria bacterium]|jgi:tetratricopeptide (TPR) repeat protein|nr:tetratricopeptide repeat protein [Gammaproteobacteria bacterium]
MMGKQFSIINAIRLTALCLLVVSCGSVLAKDYFDQKEIVVKDPFFGDALYDYYSGNTFEAIIKLIVGKDLGRVPNHMEDVDIWLGSLYLSYGMHYEAEAVFKRLIKEGASPEIRDRAWLQLAKVRYQKGLYEDAIRAIEEIQEDIPKDLKGATQLQMANVLMARGEYQQAADMLLKFPKNDQFTPYVNYNLGVALFRSDRQIEGTEYLDAVGLSRAEDEELRALRDKANIALGYVLLANDDYPRAKAYFQRVRISGPFSNKALLGLGWSDAFQQDYRRALAPWLELSTRTLSDAAVYESLLAVPYAYERLKAYQQSMQAYETAINSFSDDLNRLNLAIETVKKGKLWEQLLNNISTRESKITWELEDLPPEVESRFVYTLVSGNSFQQSIDSLRHLIYLNNSLSKQADNMDTFQYILDLREETYKERLPKLAPEKGDHRMALLKDERNLYMEEYRRIEREGDLKALATGKEQLQIERLEKIQDILRRHRHEMDPKRYRETLEKYRLYSGLLEWEIGTSIAPRLWRIRKAIRELDKELELATRQQQVLQRARLGAPRSFEGYGKKIAGYSKKIQSLQGRVQDAIDEQKQLMERQVIGELETLRQRIASYLDQAKFARAHLLDLGATQGGVN